VERIGLNALGHSARGRESVFSCAVAALERSRFDQLKVPSLSRDDNVAVLGPRFRRWLKRGYVIFESALGCRPRWGQRGPPSCGSPAIWISYTPDLPVSVLKFPD
jgi:hypothetical protein